MTDFWRTVFQMLWISMIVGFIMVGVAAGVARWADNRRWERDRDQE